MIHKKISIAVLVSLSVISTSSFAAVGGFVGSLSPNFGGIGNVGDLGGLSEPQRNAVVQKMLNSASGNVGIGGKVIVVDPTGLSDSDSLKSAYQAYLSDDDDILEDPFKSFTTYLPDAYQESLADSGEVNTFKSDISASVINSTREGYLKSREDNNTSRKKSIYNLYNDFSSDKGFDHDGYNESIANWKESASAGSSQTHDTYNSDLNALFNTYKIRVKTDISNINQTNRSNIANMVVAMKYLDYEKVSTLSDTYNTAVGTIPDLIANAQNALTLAGTFSGECGSACTLEVQPVPAPPEFMDKVTEPVPTPEPYRGGFCDEYRAEKNVTYRDWMEICGYVRDGYFIP
jgi:hypothetical protein